MQVGPAIGLIAQVVLLAALAGTVGLGDAGWVAGLACATTMATALARGVARAPGAWQGPSLGDARPGHPRRRRRRAGRGLLRTRHAGRAARGAGRRRALAGPRRRLDRAPHRDRDRAGRALRRRGRRVPDPRAQRVRRPHRRRVGARDRRGALPVPPRRVAAAVDARAAPAAPLAQGRRGRPGDRAHRRGGRRPAPVGHAGASSSPRSSPSRRPSGECVWWLWRRRPAERAPLHPGARRGVHGARPAAGLGRAGRAEPAEPARAGAFVRLPLELLVVLALAVSSRPPRAACWPSSPDRCSACS